MSSARIVAVVGLGACLLSLPAGVLAQGSGANPAPEQFRVAGRVISSTKGEPLPEARITIRDTKNPKDVHSVITGDDGRFLFQVGQGKYALLGAKRGFITASYEQHEQFSTAIVTGAGVDTENLVIQLSPMSVISGRVLDESGEPIRQAQVILWHEDHASGVSRVQRFGFDSTDDLGGYEFAPLEGGTYYLSASTVPWYAIHPPPAAAGEPESAVDRRLDVVYPTTYYSEATESEQATPISLHGGEHMDVDLRLTASPALHVLYKIESDNLNNVPVPSLRKRAFDGFEMYQNQEIHSTAPGVFEMIVAPGKYTIVSRDNGNGGGEVELSQDHQTLDTSGLEAASTMDVSLRVVGVANPPNDIFLALRSVQEGNRRSTGYQQRDDNGGLKFIGVSPGDYEIVAVSEEGQYSVVQITTDGTTRPGHVLKVPSGRAMSVSLLLEKASASVEGLVRSEGKPAAGAMVVLIPKNPESNRDWFRRDQSDLDGSFVLRNVIPGTYTLVAIADGWDLDWSRAAVISKYAAHGQRVVVPGGGKQSVQLREPLELQAK